VQPAVSALAHGVPVVRNVKIAPVSDSKYVRPLRMEFDIARRGKTVRRGWDVVQSHDAVCVLLYHVERRGFLLVRQFRPAVWLCQSEERKATDPLCGYTIELCAGLIDKAKSVEQIAKVRRAGGALPSVGVAHSRVRAGGGVGGMRLRNRHIRPGEDHRVPRCDVPRRESARARARVCACVRSWRAELADEVRRAGSVGINGSKLYIYFAQVSEKMKVADGGGAVDEEEDIEVVFVPEEKGALRRSAAGLRSRPSAHSRSRPRTALDFVLSERVDRPSSMAFSFLWFFQVFRKRALPAPL
jgi:hypothetical protein